MRLISELITERDMLDFSQGFNVQRSYTGSRLFPDRKTQYIEAEYTRLAENGNLPTVAMIHGFDTEAHIGSRVPFERVTTESLLIKEKINLSERLRRITRGLDMQMDSVRRYVFDDVARTAESVVTRAEKAKIEALTTGKMIIAENNVSMEIDFGVPRRPEGHGQVGGCRSRHPGRHRRLGDHRAGQGPDPDRGRHLQEGVLPYPAQRRRAEGHLRRQRRRASCPAWRR